MIKIKKFTKEEARLAFTLRSIRKYYKLTQKQVAEMIGKKEATIRGYENDRLRVTKELIFLLVRHLNMSRFDFENALTIARISEDTLDNENESLFFQDLADYIFPLDRGNNEKDFFSLHIHNLFIENLNFWLAALLRADLGDRFTYNEELFNSEIRKASNLIDEFTKKEIERIKYSKKSL